MARPNLSDARRGELIPAVAAAFAHLGYRRTTTAVLAERCGVPEQILYRLWPDKRAMFVAAIEFVGSNSEQVWQRALAGRKSNGSTAERVLAHEAVHLGEFGLYRILFAGFSETDDAEIARALRRVYESFLRFIREQIAAHRQSGAAAKGARRLEIELTAWAMVGLGTVANMGRELGLLPDRTRKRLMAEVGRCLLDA